MVIIIIRKRGAKSNVRELCVQVCEIILISPEISGNFMEVEA